LQSFPTIAQKVLSCDEEGISEKLPGLYHLSFACGQEVDRSRPETVSIRRQQPGGCAAVLWRRKKRRNGRLALAASPNLSKFFASCHLGISLSSQR